MAAIVFAAIVIAAAAFGAVFSPGEWYTTIKRPSWTPPNWVFGPVWTTLYVMIAAAGYLVWRAGDRGRALAFWGVNIAANAAWSWIFFGQRMIGVALIDIVVVWLTIVGFMVAAWPRSRAATLLFLPYLAWVSLATALNAAIWQLNG